MNEKSESNTDDRVYDVDKSATNLLHLFKEHMDVVKEVSHVSKKGLKEMSSYFGTVPMEERGYVFLSFLAFLFEEGFKYDLQQFLKMEAVEEDDERTDTRH